MTHTSTPKEIQAKLDRLVDGGYSSDCGCMGPQGDQPVCPCRMSNVIRWRGLWIRLEPIRPTVSPDYLNDILL